MRENFYIPFCEGGIGFALVGTLPFIALLCDLMLPPPKAPGLTVTASLLVLLAVSLRAVARLPRWFLVLMLGLSMGWTDLDCYRGVLLILLLYVCLSTEFRRAP